MLNKAYRTKVGNYQLAIEHGAIYVTDGVKVIKATAAIKLRVKGLEGYELDSEKFYYGLTVPLVSSSDRVSMIQFLETAEETLLDSLFIYLSTADYLDASALKSYLTIRNVITVVVNQKLLVQVA